MPLLVAAALGAGCVQGPPVPAPPPAVTEPPPAPVATAVAASAPTPAPPPAVDKAAQPPSPGLRRLLDFHERTQAAPVTELAREQARLAASPEPDATLQLAWLLAHGRNPGDLARAAALLDPLARGDGPEAPLAQLLLARLAEQRRLEEQLERQAQQQRDLQRRNEQLREQLEALRAIERSLGPRPGASAPRAP